MDNKFRNHSHLLLSVALLLASIALFQPLMLWIWVLVLLAVGMRITLFYDWHGNLPSIRTINLFAVLCALLLAYTGIQIGLLLAMVNLLVMACALKLMQMRTVRDYFMLVCILFFLLGCGLIFEQSIFYSFYFGFIALVVFTSLAFHIAPNKQVMDNFKLAGKIGLQSMPICLLLFLVLPQLSPLWQMPKSKSTQTGLTESITPGDIAKLSQSSNLVFRAQFANNIPAPHNRYWRAIVFEEFDGKTWSISHLRKRMKRTNFRLGRSLVPKYDNSKIFSYDVIMEPTDQNWLFALDVAEPLSRRTWLSPDFQVQSVIPIVTKYKYSVNSYPNTALQGGSDYFDVNVNLMVPEQGNPKTVAWTAGLRQQYPGNLEFIAQVEKFFLDNTFRYTLRPELMPVNPVDAFLFEHRAGFCSHYASAYAYIMRLAGIPARLVGGYQGGEMRGEDYMSIYQYDAHAWVEVWLPGQGWVRKDPTGFVAPERISLGLEAAMTHEDSFLADANFSLSSLRNLAMFNELRLILADLDFMWSKWILGFDQDKQLDLFKHLVGEIKPLRIALLVLLALVVIGLFLLFFNYRIWFPEITNYPLHYYQKAIQHLAKMGIVKEKSETPLHFLARIKNQLTANQLAPFSQLTHAIVQHEYMPLNIEQKLSIEKVTKQHWRAFRRSGGAR